MNTDPNDASFDPDDSSEPLFSSPSGGRRLGRLLVWALLLVALAVGGYLLYRYLTSTKKQVVTYRTEVAGRGTVESQVSATGTLSAVVTVQVGSQVSGRVQQLMADYNSTVKKGQVIARIDPTLYTTEVTRSRAGLASAKAGLQKALAAAEEAKLKYERDRDLAKEQVVALAEVETRRAAHKSAVAQVAVARAAVAQARAALSKAEANLTYTTIISPINGIVVSRSVDVGQTVAASLSAPTLFTIAEDLRKMEVHTSVAESDVGQLKEGLLVRFSVDAFPKDEFEGVVKQVRFEAETVQNVVTYDAVVSVENDQLKLRPGMTANITFIVEARNKALLVANSALRFQPPEGATAGKAGAGRRPGGKRPAGAAGKRPAGATGNEPVAGEAGAGAGQRGRRVWVLGADGKPTPVRVRTGISDGSHTEVTGGQLKEGQKVIIGLGNQAASAKTPTKQPRRGPPRIL